MGVYLIKIKIDFIKFLKEIIIYKKDQNFSTVIKKEFVFP